MTYDFVDMAASLEATAKEIAAAAQMYQRLPKQRSDLASGLGSLHSRLELEWAAFITKAAQELSSEPR